MQIKSIKVRTGDGRKFKTVKGKDRGSCEGCAFCHGESGACKRPSRLFTQTCSDAQAIWKEVKK